MNSAHIRVSVARTQAELEAAWRLRYEIYLQQAMIGPRPEEIELDRWDGDATTLVAHQFDDEHPDGELIGSIRICPQVNGMFPMEEHGIQIPEWVPRESVRETSRWVARPNRAARVALGLTIGVDHWLRARSQTHSISVVTPPSLRALERGPWEILRMGPIGNVTLEGGKPLVITPICMPVLDDPPEPPASIRLVLTAPQEKAEAR